MLENTLWLKNRYNFLKSFIKLLREKFITETVNINVISSKIFKKFMYSILNGIIDNNNIKEAYKQRLSDTEKYLDESESSENVDQLKNYLIKIKNLINKNDTEEEYDIDINGYDINGYNINGIDKNGVDKNGINVNGIEETRVKYPKRKNNWKNYDRVLYDQYGFNSKGFNKDGYDIYGFDINGLNKYGLNKFGYEKKSGKGLNISASLILLSKIYTNNSSKEKINDIKQLVKNLFKNKQITKKVYNILDKTLRYK